MNAEQMDTTPARPGAPTGPAASDSTDATRPARYLRVGVALTGRTARVVSVWLADAPPVSIASPGHPILTRVDVGGRLADVGRQPDPRVHRGVMRPEVGHFFGLDEAGTLYVAVPFTNVADLAAVRVRVLDATGAGIGALDRAELAGIFDEPPKRMRAIHEIGSAELRANPDWAAVAARLGMRVPAGRFEIFTDREGRYRWHLRRGDGAIVAVSGQGFTRRADLEAELAWVRAEAGGVPVESLDVGRPD